MDTQEKREETNIGYAYLLYVAGDRQAKKKSWAKDYTIPLHRR